MVGVSGVGKSFTDPQSLGKIYLQKIKKIPNPDLDPSDPDLRSWPRPEVECRPSSLGPPPCPQAAAAAIWIWWTPEVETE
jgi:hypothetical protein